MNRAGRSQRLLRSLPLAAAALAAALVAGCNTYHYYDITVQAMTPVTENETSTMNFCQVLVSGAASDTISWSNNYGCPPMKFPDLIAFEYATFADSGQITFTFNGYTQNVDPNGLCTTGTVTLPAGSTITQSGTVPLTSFNQTNCTVHVSGTGGTGM
ncbi:MAG TPA: hypothetical protein VHO06_24325 [Polyangia bacterium]|nr:hypothetical protein [Polyangia bacterium]